MKFFEVRTPFFRPLWRRVLATTICLAWALFEATSGGYLWAILFGAAGGLLAFQFFVTFEDGPALQKKDDTP